MQTKENDHKTNEENCQIIEPIVLMREKGREKEKENKKEKKVIIRARMIKM